VKEREREKEGDRERERKKEEREKLTKAAVNPDILHCQRLKNELFSQNAFCIVRISVATVRCFITNDCVLRSCQSQINWVLCSQLNLTSVISNDMRHVAYMQVILVTEYRANVGIWQLPKHASLTHEKL
jgi:hypothetical protein